VFRKDAKRAREPEVVPLLSTSDAGLDTVAAILRALAKHLATPGGAASRLEHWARHILLLVPPPTQPGAVPPVERDWDGLRRYVVRHIRDEGVSSARAIGDLQDALWAVVEGMSEALRADASEDRHAIGCLARLREAAQGSTGELKRAALEAVAELRALIESRNARHRELALALGQRVDLLRDELAEARRAASIDRLTQLANRSVLEPELQRAIHMHRLTGEPHALLLADVDGFKAVNDTLGHVAGDEALRAIADALAVSFPRRSDLVCRFGGDEFAVILREASLEDAERLACRFVELVRSREIPSGGVGIHVTVSVGVAPVETADDVASWLARADRALYDAKSGGRDRVAGALGGPGEPAAA
jgi:diguanylate cyclase (GGDEF)-like protein